MYPRSLLLGSIIARPINLLVPPAGFAGSVGVMLTIVDDPVEVAQTWPFCVPAIRTLSSAFAIAIVLMGDAGLDSGIWLTAVIVSPRSLERYKRSAPK